MNEELIQSFTAYTNALEQKISALEQRVSLLESRLSANSQTDQDVVALLGQLQERIAQVEEMSSRAAIAATEPKKDYVADDEENKPEVEVELIVDDTPEVEEQPQEEEKEEDTTIYMPEAGKNEEEEVVPVVAKTVEQPQPEVAPQAEPVLPTPQPVAKKEAPVAKEEPKAAPTQTSLFGAPVKDIRQAISLGDRFLFQRELFAGNGEKMQKTLDDLNALDTLDEALEYIRSHFDWDKDATAVQLFENVLRRRF